ncbi:MAG: YdeI/OmpD-associated family protein [Thermoleophilia bacterium]|nr:YdeI/OmpD-associated family protein [Thermoleophilia bacterium]
MSSLQRPRHPMPEDVARALDEQGLTDAYYARPPYQQNDYIGWITRAKRAGTRRARLEQMLDELAAGDAYMKMAWRPAPRQAAPARPAKPRLADLPLVELGNRAEWRAWLAKHHAESPGIWLAVGKRGNAVTTLAYEDAVEEALCFGWIDSTTNRLDGDRFKQLFTPRKPGGTWARSNKERIERLIAEGLMAPAGLAPIEAAKADGTWTMLDDVEDLVVPADLAEALWTEPDAARRYAELADSKKKQLLYWIGSAKRPATRAKRIEESVRAVAQGRMPR